MYNIAHVEDISGISAFTIRYYDKCGFFPDLARDAHGVRRFSDSDVEQLMLIDALRKSGLSIEGIKYFVKTSKDDSSKQELAEIILDRLKVLQIKKTEIDESVRCLEEAVAKFLSEDARNHGSNGVEDVNGAHHVQ